MTPPRRFAGTSPRVRAGRRRGGPNAPSSPVRARQAGPQPAPAPGRRGAAPSAGRAPGARRDARSRTARRLDHRHRGRRQPRPAQRHRLRDAAGRPGRAAPARRHAPRRAVVPRPRRRAAPACAMRRRSASRSTAPSTRPTASASCCAGPTSRATSRTIEVVLVARKEVGVGRARRHDPAVVQQLDLLVLEPFQQLGAVDPRRRQMDVDLRPRQQFQDLVACRSGSAGRCPAAPDGPW